MTGHSDRAPADLPPLDSLFRPEEELLLCCCRRWMDPEALTRARTILESPLDWAYITETALTQGVMPLLYWNLNTSFSQRAPAGALERLRGYFQAQSHQNLLLTAELTRVTALFREHHIPVLSFKGPVLASLAYGNLALRQIEDLDLLIPRDRVLEAATLLESCGYRRKLPPGQETPALHFHYHFALVAADGRVMVELHWKLTRPMIPLALSPETLTARARWVSLGGREIPTLSTEDLLLVLCAHASKHLWNRLDFVSGIAETVRACPEMDWNKLLDRSAALGARRMLLLGLLLARTLLGAALPDEVDRAVESDAALPDLARHVCKGLFAEQSDWPGLAGYLFVLRIRERFLDRAESAFRMLITPTELDWEFIRLPAGLLPGYYLARPIRLIRTYGRLVFDRLTQLTNG